MPQQVEQLKVFLASPGDVQAEREQARQVVDDINRTIGRNQGIHVDVVGWDTDAYPGFGQDAQGLINTQIADMTEYDLFVGIMWNRFGAPTPRAGSGTEEEFNLAAASFQEHGRPYIMFYFSQEPANLATEDQIEQKAKVLKFKKNVQQGGLTWNYSGAQEFRTLFQTHLSTWLLSRKQHTPNAPAPPTHAQPAQTSSASVAAPAANANTWALINNSYFVADRISISTEGVVTAIIHPRDPEEEAQLRSLNPQQYQHTGPVSFAYQNDGGLLQVQEVKVDSESGRTAITVSAKIIASSQSSLMEMAVNGYSADDIATLRARLLLLNELPAEHRQNEFMSIVGFIQGMNSAVKVEKGIFPNLWKHLQGQPELFVPLARLLAVFYLKASNTVEHILELSLGPVKNNVLPVSFRGQRKRAYANVAPSVIEVKGTCSLE